MSDFSPPEKRIRVHVVYEYGTELRPFSSSFLCLIRPLTHPLVQDHIEASFGLDYNGEAVDIVIIDRLWRQDVTLGMVKELVNKIQLKGARLVFALDDDYFDSTATYYHRPMSEVLPIVSFLCRQADAVLITTPALRQRVREYNRNILLMPNQLDERLLIYRQAMKNTLNSHKPLVIGYMGTFTHDEDLMVVLPALRSVHQRHPGKFQLQVVGVINQEQTKNVLQGLPVRYIFPALEEQEYPLFMLWFTGHVQWDIAISPLTSTPFNDCKSDIKFLDYAAIGAAGIFSRSPAYEMTVHHKENGWLAENNTEAWEEALETLLEQPDLRVEIARNASHYLYAERTLARHAADWVELIKTLR